MKKDYPAVFDHDYAEVPTFPALSSRKEAVVGYISGFVVHMTCKKIHCPDCVGALVGEDDIVLTSMQSSLMHAWSWLHGSGGGLWVLGS